MIETKIGVKQPELQTKIREGRRHGPCWNFEPFVSERLRPQKLYPADMKKLHKRPCAHYLSAMAKRDYTDDEDSETLSLDGQLLIAMPGMTDPRFERSVIFMCAHSEDGAMGIILNQPTPGVNFGDLYEQLEMSADEDAEEEEAAARQEGGALAPISAPMNERIARKPVYVGGPVETSRGFVLHSRDYFVSDITLPIESGICLTASIDILRAIAAGKGPEHLFLALGYAGWAPGQLENELQQNGWLHCPVDFDLVFNTHVDRKYDRALSLLGIDPGFLAAEAGHA